MKSRIKDAYHIGGLWAVLLVALGFVVSCEGATMYGSPYADYEIKALVVDSADAPIPNMRVRMNYTDNTTNSDGVAQCNFQSGGVGQPVICSFEDIDGEQNGGKFKLLDTMFYLDGLGFEKGNKRRNEWYEGRLKAQVRVVMQREKQK